MTGSAGLQKRKPLIIGIFLILLAILLFGGTSQINNANPSTSLSVDSSSSLSNSHPLTPSSSSSSKPHPIETKVDNDNEEIEESEGTKAAENEGKQQHEEPATKKKKPSSSIPVRARTGALDVEMNNHTRIIYEKYKRMHDNAIEAIKNGAPPRLVIAESTNQAGNCNRMLHMASSFLFALLSDRALVFDWHETAPEKYWEGVETMAQADYATLFEHPGFEYDLNTVKNMHNNVHQGCASSHFLGYDYENDVACMTLEKQFVTPVVRIQRFDWWAPLLIENPHYKDAIKEMFGGNTDGIFHDIARILFRPSTKTEALITQMSDGCSVGVQIRRNWARPTATDDAFLSCAQKAQREHNAQAAAADSKHDFSIKIDAETGEKYQDDDSESSWFLATDAPSSRDYFKNLDKSKSNSKSVVVSPSDGACRTQSSCHNAAIADMWRLSTCSSVVTSFKSTYGMCAASIGGTKPYIVSPEGQCTRANAVDPIDAGGNSMTPFIQQGCAAKASPRGAIVMLAVHPSEHSLNNLKDALGRIDRFFNHVSASRRYPIVLFTHDINAVKHVQTWTNTHIIFAELDRSTWEIPSFLDKSAIPEWWNPGDPYPSDFKGFSLDYRHMGRFAAGPMFLHPALKRFDYFLKIDTDAFMLGEFNVDPIESMWRNKQRFAYWHQYTDHPVVTTGLWEAMQEYMKLKNLSFKIPNMVVWEGNYRRTNMYGCFLGGDLNFFRSKEYQELFDFFDRKGGIYMHRWDEQKIYSFALAIYLDQHEFHYMDYARVDHQGISTPNRCCF